MISYLYKGRKKVMMDIAQLYKKYPTREDCIAHLEAVRWRGKPRCPYCMSDRVGRNEHRFHCNMCNTSFSVTVKTIFHKTKVDLQRWFYAIHIVLNAKNDISARQFAGDVGVNKNTAWFMLVRIRQAMIEHGAFLKSIVDEERMRYGSVKKQIL